MNSVAIALAIAITGQQTAAEDAAQASAEASQAAADAAKPPAPGICDAIAAAMARLNWETGLATAMLTDARSAQDKAIRATADSRYDPRRTHGVRGRSAQQIGRNQIT